MALIGVTVPLLYQSLLGETVPPADAAMPRKYCVVKLAVYVVSVVGATVWEIAPPSLQLLQMNRIVVTG